MGVTNMASSDLQLLPVETWAFIFQFLDEKTLRESATLVCKHWFEIIRGDSNLSGKLTLNLWKEGFVFNTPGPKASMVKLNAILPSWPKLKHLRIIKRGHFVVNDAILLDLPTDFQVDILLHNISSNCEKLDDFKRLWNTPFLESLSIEIRETGNYDFVMLLDNIQQSGTICVRYVPPFSQMSWSWIPDYPEDNWRLLKNILRMWSKLKSLHIEFTNGVNPRRSTERSDKLYE